MMREWTGQQKQVIDFRGRDLLVAAGAGSGKTAVLVERILSLITDEKDAVDIDRLLVVTFTSAAAGEMKERIQQSLRKRLEADPGNHNLQKQISLLPHAKISTIHSFCLDVVRSHFQEADIDPSFRIGDEGEMKLMREDILAELLEEEYQNQDPAFLRFTSVYAPGRDDTVLEKLIGTLYDYSMAYPWPAEWRRNCLSMYLPGSPEEMEKSSWMECAGRQAKEKLEELQEETRRAIDICNETYGPLVYEDALKSDLQLIETLAGAGGYDGLHQLLTHGLVFETLSRKKAANEAEEQLREKVKAMRNGVKEELKRMAKQYERSSGELFALLRETAPDLRELVTLTDRFEEAYTKEKREKNLVDFSDLEHLALKILVTREKENIRMTAAACEYASLFREVMVDEYQDSNLLQEVILNAVSGNLAGGHKRFMVGDVKQSIYRFRQARPEIFMNKYDLYRNGLADGQKIDLNRNFRSRIQVLDFVNHLFSRIMTRELGGVAYDEDARLVPGMDAYREKSAFCVPEILVIPEKEENGEPEKIISMDEWEENDEAVREEDKLTREARQVARRIRELVADGQIRDQETGQERRVKYGDIAILIRSLSVCAQTFGRVFDEEGIPYYTGSGTGYFSAVEIRTMLNYLSLVDNPLQDIPLAAILRSPIGKLTDEELSRVRLFHPDVNLYTALREYGEAKEDTAAQKIRSFLEVFTQIRSMSARLTIHELLWEIRSLTGYGAWVLTMPGAERRKANLDMLSEKAEAFETGSYQGLFQFIRYIEQLYKYEVDYGEAPLDSEEKGCVRLMSIHKSKGLEFPIVFVSTLGRQFNQQDTRGILVLHPTLGIGVDALDPDLRIRRQLFPRSVISRETVRDNLGEELRVLYVAMTRAREKLILTGTVKDAGNLPLADPAGGRPYILSKARCFLDWILPALPGIADCKDDLPLYRLLPCSMSQVPEIPEEKPVTEDGEEGLGEALRSRLEWLFSKEPGEGLQAVPVKLSVSEIKKAGGEDEEARAFYEQHADTRPVPSFAGGDPMTGAARGTLYHLIMQNLSFIEPFDPNFLDRQLESMIKYGKIQKDQKKYICLSQLEAFLNSPLALRMRRAAQKGRLHRETPFVMALDAGSIKTDWRGEEQVLVQGIMDAWFEEDDRIILLDYKTDQVSSAEMLTARYARQLDLYATALERLTGKTVTEKILYSFCLSETIVLGQKEDSEE